MCLVHFSIVLLVNNFTNYIEADDESVNYTELSDEIITPEIKTDAIKNDLTPKS